MEQPKDYEKIETLEEFLDSGYNELNLWGRITYFLEDHVWKAIFIAGIAGYIAGYIDDTHFGIF